MVPALDCTNKVLAHLSDAMQEHYEPMRKIKEDLHSVYMKYTCTSYLNGSMAFRNPTELKEADKEGVKAWLASFETKDKEAGTKSNADKLFIPVGAQLAQITDQFIKHLYVDYPQPRAVMYKKLFT